MTKSQRINTKAEADAQAMAWSGLEQEGLIVTATRIVVRASNVPFLAARIDGRAAWRVHIDGARLHLKSALPDATEVYEHGFDVLLDEQTGQLLEITSTFSGDTTDMRPEPDAIAAEAQLRGEGEEYTDLATDSPPLRFIDAVDAVLARGIGSPLVAREITGICVLHTYHGAKPRRVWVINLRGLPPIPAHGPGGDQIPVWQRNHMRNVIDAQTGELIFATNSPQP